MFLFWLMVISIGSWMRKWDLKFKQPKWNSCEEFSGLTLLDKLKSADIRESLNTESLLFQLEKSQLCWYGHVTRMSFERTAKKLLRSPPIGRKPKGRPRTQWREYVEYLSWYRLGIPPEHLSFVAKSRDAWRLQLEQPPPRPHTNKRL